MVNSNKLIGLTGGMGCGKSTVLNIFRSLGCDTMDADNICHELYENDSLVISQIMDRWGPSLLDKNNKLDRKKIAKIVFKDKKELEWLNSLLHILVLKKAKEYIADKKNMTIFDVPLLFEADWQYHFDVTIAVWTTRELQSKRLKGKGWTEQEISSRIKFQMSADEKLERADFGIINIGSMELLIKQCKCILLEITR